MEKKISGKIIKKREDIINHKSKKIVLCHGVFDVFHIGHLMHLKNAKSKGDILIVSITADQYVNKGPNRPYFNQSYRATLLASIDFINYIYISNSKTAEKALNDLKPDFFAKGEEYKNEKNDISKNIIYEKNILKKNKGKIIFTNDKKFSSTDLVNNFFDVFSSQQKKFINQIKKKFSKSNILEIIESFSNVEVTLIGDALIDNYCYVNTLGLTAKNPTISSEYLYEEKYFGGVLATAEMLASLGSKVNLILYNYCQEKNHKLISKFNKKIKVFFIKNNNKRNYIPTKTRFLNKTRDIKLFQISNINQIKLSEIEENKYIKIIKKLNTKNNFLLLLDFGFGVFNEKFIKKIYKINKNIFLNVQTNSNNFGFNYFTKYSKFFYLSVDRREYELALSKKIQIENINKYILKKNLISITLGEQGSIFYNKKRIFNCPSFFLNAKDTTGCGDAYFIITSLLIKLGHKDEIVPFLGNCYAGLHSRIVGNKSFPSSIELAKTVTTLLT